MTELPYPLTIHNKLKWFNVTPKRLLRLRKYLMLMSVFMVVAAAIDYYVQGLSLQVALDFILAVAAFAFSTKCETLYLKLKIEEQLEKLEKQV